MLGIQISSSKHLFRRGSMRRRGISASLLALAVLLSTITAGCSLADPAVDLDLPLEIAGPGAALTVTLTNHADEDVTVTRVLADIQISEEQKARLSIFGTGDVVLVFNGTEGIPAGGTHIFEREVFMGMVTGQIDVMVTVRFLEAGATEETVVNRTFPVTFYLEDPEPLQEPDGPNRLGIFSFLFFITWPLLMLAFFVRSSIYDFEMKKTMEEETISELQWFKWFDLIWWAQGHKLAVAILYGLLALLIAFWGAYVW